MQRRNGNNPRRLARRKSTASVKSVRLHYIAPETAEQHAQVAATQAFVRARDRSATDSNSPLWPPPRSADSCSNMHIYPSDSTMTPANEAALLRQQSIRFVPSGPTLLPASSSMGRDTSPSQVSTHQSVSVAEDVRPSSSASVSGMVSAAKGAAGDYISTLFAKDEYYTPQDGIASLPSSYRKLRKSKSMFTNTTVTMPPKSPDRTSASANLLPRPTTTCSQTRSSEKNPLRRRVLKAPKSMSFLRDLRGSIGPAFKYEDNSHTLSSTTGYHENHDGARPSLRLKSSMLFRSKAVNEGRTFRKSMRDASNGRFSSNGKQLNDGSLRLKARKMSQGFKYKLKSLLGLSRDSDDDTEFPRQHIEAHKPYPFDNEDAEYKTEEEFPDISPTDQPALSQVTSGIPALHRVPPYQQLRSHQGSIESLHSEPKASDERSRVTSWSNSDSSAANTLGSSCREDSRKRLSIINENGAHICSSSAHLATTSERSNESTTSLHQPLQAPQSGVDGRRVYSALLKRMKQSQESEDNDLEREHSVQELVQSGTVPRRKSSLRSWHSTRDTASTIRYVMPESDSESEFMEASASLRTGNERCSPSVGASKPLPPDNEAKQVAREHAASESIYTNNTGDAPSRDADGKLRTKPALVPTLSSRSSAFFGSPTRHLFRTQSPYRRVLQQRMKNNDSNNEQAVTPSEFNPWMRSLSNIPTLPMPYLNTYGSDADIKLNYTESIYSNQTEDVRQSVLSIAENPQLPKTTHGDVTIFVNPPSYTTRSSSVPPKPRVSSSSSSVEWKTWLSSNVSKLEDSTRCVDISDFHSGLSSSQTSRHVREIAQIHDEDDLLSGLPDTPSRVRVGANRFINLDCENQDEDYDKYKDKTKGIDDFDDDDDECCDTDLPVSFDAGDSRPALAARLPRVSSLSTSTPGSGGMSPAIPPRAITHNTSLELSDVNHEKELPTVPSRTFKENAVNRHENISSKYLKRQLQIKTSMSTLTNRTPGGDHSEKANKLSNPQQKIADITSAKLENISPGTVDGNDPFQGNSVLGHRQRGLGSDRMVNIFLDSRRRRIVSDDGSVFL